ncbi:hypothetical protein LTR86_003451 [Recurvomyces mirabilis]|nr:hypothetical protein LTR86_003451 [Recurvomyces mirabilis]
MDHIDITQTRKWIAAGFLLLAKTTTINAQSSPPPADLAKRGSDLSAGARAGIAIAMILMILLTLTIFVYRRIRDRQRQFEQRAAAVEAHEIGPSGPGPEVGMGNQGGLGRL